MADEDDNVESSAESALLDLASSAKGIDAQVFASRLNDPNPKIVMISAFCLTRLKD